MLGPQVGDQRTLATFKLSGEGRKEPFRILMLNLFVVTAKKRTLGIPHAGQLQRQRPENSKDRYPWDTSSSEARYLCWTISEAKEPLGSPCWSSIKSEARET